MIKFLLKGLIRDKTRSLFPIIIVTVGVMITSLLYSYMNGMLSDMVRSSAIFGAGHVKVMTKDYSEISDQVPNDLAIFNAGAVISKLEKNYPDLNFSPRIKFGGLLDFPDKNGETKAQGPIFGIAVDLLRKNSREVKRLNIKKSIIRGRFPVSPGEALVSEKFLKEMGVEVNETATLISSTADNSMAVYNFKIVGTVSFGVEVMDRGAMIADIHDLQNALYMDDGAGEILGFFKDEIFDDGKAARTMDDFNKKNTNDDFPNIMLTLRDQNEMGTMIDFYNYAGFFMVFLFVFSMSIVLWNTGLMGGIRRYGEVGVRLALGESKTDIYYSMILEGVFIGVVGSTIGTLFALGFAYYLQEVGFDISESIKGSSMMISSVIRAKITPVSFFIGFIPGLFAILFGTMISGIGIFKRETAILFRETEL